MADPIWRMPKVNFQENWWKYLLRVFWVADYESDIRFPKFKMADPIRRPLKWYFLRIFIKIFTTWFFGWLITNLMSDFQNLRWWIQYGGRRSVTFQEYWWKFLLWGFSGGWLRISCQIFKIQDGGFVISDPKNLLVNIFINILEE